MTDIEKVKLYFESHINALSTLLKDPFYAGEGVVRKAIYETRLDAYQTMLEWLNRLESNNDAEQD